MTIDEFTRRVKLARMFLESMKEVIEPVFREQPREIRGTRLNQTEMKLADLTKKFIDLESDLKR